MATKENLPSGSTPNQTPIRVIRAYGARKSSIFRDLYDARFMFWNIVRTSAMLPYNDLFLGFIWTMVRPLVFLLVVVFIKHSSGANMGNSIEYELFVFAGIISWWYFSDATSNSAKSIYNYRNIITKMYFPRTIIPLMPVVVRAFDWGVQFVTLFLLMIYYGRFPGTTFWLFPVSVLTLMALATAVGFIFAVLSTYFRDVQQILGNALYVGLFLSPVIFSADLVPERYQLLYSILNPTVGPLINIRAGLFADFPPDYQALAISVVITAALFAIGIFAYTRIEDELPERVL